MNPGQRECSSHTLGTRHPRGVNPQTKPAPLPRSSLSPALSAAESLQGNKPGHNPPENNKRDTCPDTPIASCHFANYNESRKRGLALARPRAVTLTLEGKASVSFFSGLHHICLNPPREVLTSLSDQTTPSPCQTAQ